MNTDKGGSQGYNEVKYSGGGMFCRQNDQLVAPALVPSIFVATVAAVLETQGEKRHDEKNL